MFLTAYDVISFIENKLVWGIPLIALILICGVVLTIRLKGIQVTKIGKSLKYMIANDKSGGKGEISSFAALCMSMAATLGTGKIIGVATAIRLGGPGALFWMILAAMFGMATKYAEGFLSIKYREINADGTVIGGPFTYIEKGMGNKWKFLAIMFAVFGVFAGVMGIGTTTQMNSITDSVVQVFDPEITNYVTVFGHNISIYAIIVGAVITILSGIIVIGGVQRVSTVSTYVVPFMAIAFFLVCLFVVIFNINLLPQAIASIFTSAFSFKAGVGAAAGIGIMTAMQQGFSKGVFSNEAGLGSTPIALASSQSNDPVRQGLVCMASTFIDTMVLCLTIGLGIVMMGQYKTNEGVSITISSFSQGLHISNLASAIIVMLCILAFAFTTIIGWNIYGEKCVAYLSNNNKKLITIYRVIYIIMVGLAPYLTLDIIWSVASIANGLMALPNLIGLIALSGIVSRETNEYFKNKKLQKELVNTNLEAK